MGRVHVRRQHEAILGEEAMTEPKNEEEKPKEILDELYFSTVEGVPMLTLHCRRKDCWLEAPGMVKHWPTGSASRCLARSAGSSYGS